jgi:hypothetical protein
MKLYIAGTMQGFPDHNWPAFHEEARLLRDAGYEVVSPAELHGPYEEALKKGREGCLRTDLKALLECDGIALLPGWTKSQGATLERQVGEAVGMQIKWAVTWRNPIVASLDGDIA